MIVGAGVKSAADIKVALGLGAEGFAIASSIVKADDPRAKLEELVGAYDE